jgi:predicted enzyme related to lactoylglutathione lyase
MRRLERAAALLRNTDRSVADICCTVGLPATGLFFATDDIQSTYEELKSRGVEFQQEPTEQPYGVDAGFRDPSANQMRVAQRT